MTTVKLVSFDKPTNLRFKDLTGQRFGRWTVLDFAGADASSKKYWKCRCECGTESIINASNLKCGDSKSCGCLHKEIVTKHGEYEASEYGIWKSMIHRCTNPRYWAYKKYGARGITVCERWLKYENFLADMGRRPSMNHSLDRIDNDGPYSPENTRWATKEQQARNKRKNRYITFDGKTLLIGEWAKIVGMNVSSIEKRLKKGWSIRKALTTPPRPY